MKQRDFEKELGAKIAKLRIEKGLSQAEAAKQLDLPRREVLTDWENANRHIKAADLIKLAEYYDVSVDYLLGLSDVKKVNSDVKGIRDYTGLTEKSLEILHFYKGFTSVNKLIENSENLFMPFHELEFDTSIARQDYENIKKDLQNGTISARKAHRAFSYLLDFIEQYYYPLKERLESFSNFYGTRELIFAITESKTQIEREEKILWIDYPRYKRYSSSDYSYSEFDSDNGKAGDE